jgi:NAD+ diphosphatase
MIQDIAPYKLKNEYCPRSFKESDRVVAFDDKDRILAKCDGGKLEFLHPHDNCPEALVYLFSIAGFGYYMADKCERIPDDYSFQTIRQLRDCAEGYELFAAFTAYHLHKWYFQNRFCGSCGAPTEQDAKERALRCTKCGNIVYPRINPAVIVGVINEDSLLITRYKTGYAHNALIAGFTEIGETLEETVEREVMEEAGIRVRNIRYYKSQPWGMAMDILVGFYCDACDTDIKMDDSELKYAQWTKREDIVLQPNDLSLTNEMMRMFKEGKITKVLT